MVNIRPRIGGKGGLLRKGRSTGGDGAGGTPEGALPFGGGAFIGRILATLSLSKSEEEE